MHCPLCLQSTRTSLIGVLSRTFHHCSQCDLVFLDPALRLSPEEEKRRYETHNNDVTDPRYQNFVRPLFDTVCEAVPLPASGLDFGAGTGPVLCQMLEERGYSVRKYDPFFWPDPELLNFQYDFVAACEVVEHFADPAKEFALLRRLVKPGAPLALMTLLRSDETDLTSWYYLKDPTHISAYSRKTFHWIAEAYGFSRVEFRSDRVIVLE